METLRATADFVLFGVDPPRSGKNGARLVVARSEIMRMTVSDPRECACVNGVRGGCSSSRVAK